MQGKVQAKGIQARERFAGDVWILTMENGIFGRASEEEASPMMIGNPVVACEIKYTTARAHLQEPSTDISSPIVPRRSIPNVIACSVRQPLPISPSLSKGSTG